jgi:hypothetical protein
MLRGEEGEAVERLAFSLRGLLLLILLVATFLGGWKASDWYRERELNRAASEDTRRRLEFFQSLETRLQAGQTPTLPLSNSSPNIEITGDTIRIRGHVECDCFGRGGVRFSC